MSQPSTPHTALWNSRFVSAASLAPVECTPDDHLGVQPYSKLCCSYRSALPLQDGNLSCPIRKIPHRTQTAQPPEKNPGFIFLSFFCPSFSLSMQRLKLFLRFLSNTNHHLSLHTLLAFQDDTGIPFKSGATCCLKGLTFTKRENILWWV